MSFSHKNYFASLLLLIASSTSLFGMADKNSMKTERNNAYNAFTLFGDSEPLGIAGKKQRTTIKTREAEIQQHKEIIKPLDKLLTDLQHDLAKPNLHPEDRKILQQFVNLTHINKELGLRKANAVLGPNDQFSNPHTSRSELLVALKANLKTLENLKAYFAENEQSDLVQQVKQIIAIHEREQFIHSQLKELSMSESIGVECSLGEDDTGRALKNNFNNHEYAKVVYDESYPLLAIKQTALHELGHIYYRDNYDSARNKNSANIALAQISAPFISYFVSLAMIRFNKSPRLALPFGIASALASYAANCTYTYSRSRAIELRADTFAIKKLLQDKDFMPVYDTIFTELRVEEAYRADGLETQFRSRFGTHPQPVKRALNCIQLLEENGTPFNKEQVTEYFNYVTPQHADKLSGLMHKYLPAELLLKAGIEKPEIK